MALTFLTGINGVYFYYSLARLPRESPETSPRIQQGDHLLPDPACRRSRETQHQKIELSKNHTFTMAYKTNFVLFHDITEAGDT